MPARSFNDPTISCRDRNLSSVAIVAQRAKTRPEIPAMAYQKAVLVVRKRNVDHRAAAGRQVLNDLFRRQRKGAGLAGIEIREAAVRLIDHHDFVLPGRQPRADRRFPQQGKWPLVLFGRSNVDQFMSNVGRADFVRPPGSPNVADRRWPDRRWPGDAVR